jgi:hypothetical protein
VADRQRVLRIHVTEAHRDRVNITVPLGLAHLAKIGGVAAKLSARHGLDIEELLDEIEHAPGGKMIHLADERRGDLVELFVELRDPGSATATMLAQRG